MNTLWFVLFGTWDDETTINKFVLKIKSMFGVDFSNYQKPGVVATLLNYSLRKFRKNINNSMNASNGMTLQKSIVTHTVVGKIAMTNEKNDMRKCFHEVSGW